MGINYKVVLTAKARDEIEEMPKSCSVIEQYKDRKYEYRKLIINNYVAIYRIDEENKVVYIIRIVYGGRNYLNEI